MFVMFVFTFILVLDTVNVVLLVKQRTFPRIGHDLVLLISIRN